MGDDGRGEGEGENIEWGGMTDRNKYNHGVSYMVVAKFATTALDGKIYQVEHYNLDMIISVGYRVKSNRGVEFRKWANKVLKQYII